MNPFGIILIGLGIIIFIVGFKGSQHEVVNAFQGIAGKEKPYQATAYQELPPNQGTTQTVTSPSQVSAV